MVVPHSFGLRVLRPTNENKAGRILDVFKSHQWMANTLFDMAAFCEKNDLEKPRDLLIETAVTLSCCLAALEANNAPMPPQPTGGMQS